jgi:hypothetical protein
MQKPRLILMPTWHERMGELERSTGLPKRMREEIDQFFVSATSSPARIQRSKGGAVTKLRLRS